MFEMQRHQSNWESLFLSPYLGFSRNFCCAYYRPSPVHWNIQSRKVPHRISSSSSQGGLFKKISQKGNLLSFCLFIYYIQIDNVKYQFMALKRVAKINGYHSPTVGQKYKSMYWLESRHWDLSSDAINFSYWRM